MDMDREWVRQGDIPAIWRPNGRYISCCSRCGREGLKRNMAGLYVKRSSCENVKILVYICRECYAAFLEEMGISEEPHHTAARDGGG